MKASAELQSRLDVLEVLYRAAVAEGRGSPADRETWAAGIAKHRQTIEEMRRAEDGLELAAALKEEIEAISILVEHNDPPAQVN